MNTRTYTFALAKSIFYAQQFSSLLNYWFALNGSKSVASFGECVCVCACCGNCCKSALNKLNVTACRHFVHTRTHEHFVKCWLKKVSSFKGLFDSLNATFFHRFRVACAIEKNIQHVFAVLLTPNGKLYCVLLFVVGLWGHGPSFSSLSLC